MATLNFSFAGESINAAKLESRQRKFQLEFEPPGTIQLAGKTVFSVEYFYSIHKYAEHLSEAFHLAAAESRIHIERLSIHICGNINNVPTNEQERLGHSLFNRIDVSLTIVSDTPDVILERVLAFAKELNPVDEKISDKVQFYYSLSSVVHLN